MRISNFDYAEDNDPKQADFTWESFAATLGPHEYRPGGATPKEDKRLKELCPCFSPAEYPDGVKRGKKNVLRVWMFVLDVDHIDEATAHWVIGRLREMNLAAVVYSTWTHARDPWRFRVVIPLDRPVDGAAWPSFWARAITLFNSICDLRCKDASRLYFGPFAPIGTEHLNFYHVYQGAALPVDYVMSLPLPEGSSEGDDEVEQVRSKDAEAVAALVAAWPNERRHEAHLALAGGLLSSGFSNDRALDFLCAVARGQDPDNEDRDKRQSIVEHTREQLDANEKITGWTTLASIVGYDVIERVRPLVERAPTINEDQLLRYAKTLKKNKIDYKTDLGDALDRVCTKRVFPEALALRLAAELGARFPDYDPKSIAQHFEHSLGLMRAAGEDVTVEQIEARIKLKQDEVRQQRNEQRKKHEQQQKAIEFDKASRIREAYRNGRSHPYTFDELQQWKDIVGTGHRWILQKDRSFYLFFHGSYKGPYSEAEAHGAALRELSAAASAGVDIYKTNKDGSSDFKSLRQLIAEYGTVVEKISTDLRAQVITYNEQERTIVEAPCPLRKLEPRYDPDVDQWMYQLAGDKHYDDLKTWFAILPRLDIVRSALALIGKHSVGKSLTALSGSGLWTKDGPCMLEQALADFNDSILRCPLIFADEHLPKDFRGTTPTEQLRQFIQATERPLKRKHLPNSKCLGVTPLLIAAHDLEVLRPSENISNNEVEGSVLRFLIIPARVEAAHFLANLRPTTHQRGWVENDIVARHIWWLVHNHKHESKGRFYFQPSNPEHAMWFATSGGAKSALLRWLVSFLANRKKFESDPNSLMHVRVHKGYLYVNIGGVLACWDRYIGNEKCPNAGLLSRLLAEISYPERQKMKDGKGKMVNYRVVISDYLYTWAKNTDLLDAEELAKQLSIDSVETSVGLTA
ncbi:MAG: hypothetical protein AMXMBFR56_61740 [Polyangiaceae bacterium]